VIKNLTWVAQCRSHRSQFRPDQCSYPLGEQTVVECRVSGVCLPSMMSSSGKRRGSSSRNAVISESVPSSRTEDFDLSFLATKHCAVRHGGLGRTFSESLDQETERQASAGTRLFDCKHMQILESPAQLKASMRRWGCIHRNTTFSKI